MKNIYYGLLHVLVAITSILFVTGVTGINLSVAFFTVGLGTLLFHHITKNKLAILLGVSGSYIAGMVYIATTYGPHYVAGGVVMSGVVYMIIGTIAKFYPKIITAFPKYVLNMAVFLIALTLLPIGAQLVSNAPVVAGITVLVLLITQVIKPIKPYSLPIGLIAGTITAAYRGKLAGSAIHLNMVITTPQFNWAAFTMIGIVAVAVVFETLANAQNCANAQEIELTNDDIARVIQADGAASFLSGMVGGLPLTSYGENVGFIYMSGWKNPTAQLYSSFIFIAMGLTPGWAELFRFIPTEVYGAILIYLFSTVAANAFKNTEVTDQNIGIIILMILVFYITPAVSAIISPIAAAIVIGVIGDVIWERLRKGR